MDLVLNSIAPGSICEGCLCVDRKLSTVFSEEIKRFFGEILDPLDHINHPLSLCWECTAVLYRMMRFKKQVRHAHDCLVRYMLHQTRTLISLSKLDKTTNVSLQQITRFGDETMKDETEDPGNNPNMEGTFNKLTKSKTAVTQFKTDETLMKSSQYSGLLINAPNNRTTENTSKSNSTSQGYETQPVFIKIEEEGDEFDNLEGFYVDESAGDHIGDETVDDDKDLKEVLKTDTHPYEVPITSKTKSKSKKSKRKRKAEEFNDSDDEPLTLKKQKETEDKEYKPRGRRKKKENIGPGPHLDRRKHPAPKREKPSGVVDTPRVRRKLQQLNVASGHVEMVVLSWEEVEAERARARDSSAYTRHRYRCADCVLGFNHQFKLINHMAKHDPSAGAAQCDVCRVRCRDAHALCAHRRRHRVRWRCCSCGETWSRAAVAADHHARAHGAAQPTHTCSVCGHQETTLGKLRNHIKNHAERQKCELCGKTFRDRTSLRTHLFIHKGEKEYACPQCEKRFLFKKAMEVHLVTHLVSEQLYCYQCDMNFKNRMSYYQHMKYNLKHVDPAMLKHACSLCDKRFVKAARLQEHHVAVHLKATPIRCTTPGCNFACSSRPVLRTHIRMVHRNVRLVRNHVCDTCGKAYTTKKTLEGHMRTHTGERPFHCGLCPSTFGYEAALYNHNKLVHLKAKTGRGRAASAAVPPVLAPPVPQVEASGPPIVAPEPEVPEIAAPAAWQLTLNS